MNYGLIPVSVCETLYRESENLRKIVVGSNSLPFLLFLCYLIGGFLFLKGY